MNAKTAATTMDRPPLRTPPRGQRFADATVAVVWAAVQTLPEASKHTLLRELREELAIAGDASGSAGQREARAIRSLREAADLLSERPDLDGALSLERYRELSAIEGKHAGWAADGSIRRWFGGVSWNDCLRRAGLDLIAGGDVRVAELGAAFTAGEIVDALQECANDPVVMLPPTLSEYLAWARKPDVRIRPGRRPLSQGPFDRVFGGFSAAVRAAGLADGDGDGPTRVSVDGSGRRRVVAARGYSDAQLASALAEVAGRLGRSPKTGEYTHQCLELLDEEAAAGLASRALPSYQTYIRRFPSWDDALLFARLEPVNGRAHPARYKRRGPSKRKIPEAELLQTIRDAYAELGDPFTVKRFQRWRTERLAAVRTRRRPARVASYHAIWLHFGDWATACDRALGVDQPVLAAAADAATVKRAAALFAAANAQLRA